MTDSEKPPMVLLPSGKLVPAIRTELEPHEATPEHLLAWLDKYGDRVPPAVAAFQRTLCNDRRMSDFWSWLGSVKFQRIDTLRSSHTVANQIHRSTKLPGKPGNLTPATRAAYFKKIRAHAMALQELLGGTMYDNDYMRELGDDELNKSLSDALYSWGGDEEVEGHTVAYQVTPDGRYQHHYNFPDSQLTHTLMNVVDWTYWDDHWDGGIWNSSAPIVQANSESTPTVYFCCTLHEWFHQKGVELPFPILATVANVALNLTADKQVDEDAVRKQVRRYQARLAKERGPRPEAFTGQNLDDSRDSVLSDPF